MKPFNFKLICLEGKQGGYSRALDCGGQLALVFSASAAHSAGQNFSAFGNEFFKTVYVFIIYKSSLFLTEYAYLSAGNPFIALFGSCGFILFHN